MSLEELNKECDRLRQLMHEAPLNTLRTDANGHKWIGSNSMAYADRSREWMAACDRRDAALSTLKPEGEQISGEAVERDMLSEIAHLITGVYVSTCCARTGGRGGASAHPHCDCRSTAEEILALIRTKP